MSAAPAIQAAVPPPTGPPMGGGFQSKGGPREKAAYNNRKYGTPLPILLPTSPLHPASRAPKTTEQAGFLASCTPSLFASTSSVSHAIEVPTVIGNFDAATQSVWVSGDRDMSLLFNRGFFGKGTLSRSEPSWRQRRIELVRGGSALAAEQIREERRQKRKQFKIDRAAAMLDAAKKAEAVLTTGELPEGVTVDDIQPQNGDRPQPATEAQSQPTETEATGDAPAGLASPTQSTISLATDHTSALPAGTKLTAQTFLVRPTRPDTNRNRGKKAFKRRPPPPAGQQQQQRPPPPPVIEIESDSEPSEDEAAALVEEMEVLQLSLEDAWFLSEGLGVLKIRDPESDTLLTPPAVRALFLTPVDPEISLAPPAALFPDDPLFVSYAAYHHYRSLGWCVRSGIKFCVDWLLYRRGPVFSHSAFSILMIPVYMDEADRALSPYGNSDWYQERMSWKWMNTIMRVNSLVMKTVIVAYITIPSLASFPASMRLENGRGLDPRKCDMRSLMERFSVREVSLMRFSPARRRD